MSDIRDFCPLWGEWEAEKKLGEGSFGAVWKVKRNAIGGRVYFAAVKHISIPKEDSELGNLVAEGIFSNEESAKKYYDQMLQSIVQEIDAMHKLQGYTNIVAYEDHEIIPKKGGIGYDLLLRMELLTPLGERIREGASVSDVVSMGKDIATAVDVLYKHHMIHRDIKPQNIFVSDKGVYKLGDYGTARALGNGATEMSRKGTYNYMSPEIYNNQKADIRADIYSLGLVLYRLLNGNRLPFLPTDRRITSGDSEAAVVRRVSGEKIPAPKNADVELSRIVLKACAFNPEDRYRTPDELVRALEGYKGKTKQLKQERNENSDRTGEESESVDFHFGSVSKSTGSDSSTGSRPKATGAPERDRNEKTTAEIPQQAAKDTSAVSKPVQAKSEPSPIKKTEPKPEPKTEPKTTKPSDSGKQNKKPWLIPLIAILAIGLIAGGLFAAGILPPKGPEPTATPVVTATPVITEIPTASPTEAPTDTPTVNPTEPPTPEPTDTPTPEPTDTPTPVPTDTPTPVPTDTPTPVPTDTPTPVPTDTPTPVPTDTPTPVPTDTPTPVPTDTPTPVPTDTPTPVPTDTPTPVPIAEEITEELQPPETKSYVAAGSTFTIAVLQKGTCVSTGRAPDVSRWKDIVYICADQYNAAGIRKNGTVVCTNTELSEKSWKNIIKLDLGSELFGENEYIVGLCADGTAVACGANNNGQCDVSGWDSIIDISAGFSHTVGLRADGTVVATGDNTYGQCDTGDWTDIIDVAAARYSTYGLKKNGRIIATGVVNGDGDSREPLPKDFTEWDNITAIIADNETGMARDYVIGIRKDGTIVTNRTETYISYEEVSAFRDVVSVACDSWGYIVCTDSEGKAYSIGYDVDGTRNVTKWTRIKTK